MMSVSPPHHHHNHGGRLGCTWTVWRDSWERTPDATTQRLVELASVETMKNFWNSFNSHPVNSIPVDSSLHVFRKRVKPEWEDPSNINGGHLRLAAPATQSDSKGWLDLCLAVVAEQLPNAASICGVGYTRKATKNILSVWVQTCDEAILTPTNRAIMVLVGPHYTAKFVTHRLMAAANTQPTAHHTQQQTREHRRTKSAPDKYIQVESDDEEESALRVSASVQVKRPGSGTSSPTTPFEKKTRPVPCPLDPHVIPGTESTPRPEPDHSSSPEDVAAFEEDTSSRPSKRRSKSAGECQEFVPKEPLPKGPTPPATDSPSKMLGDLRSSTDSLQAQSSAGIPPAPYTMAVNAATIAKLAPSPMKGGWADSPWSPSLLLEQTPHAPTPSEGRGKFPLPNRQPSPQHHQSPAPHQQRDSDYYRQPDTSHHYHQQTHAKPAIARPLEVRTQQHGIQPPAPVAVTPVNSTQPRAQIPPVRPGSPTPIPKYGGSPPTTLGHATKAIYNQDQSHSKPTTNLDTSNSRTPEPKGETDNKSQSSPFVARQWLYPGGLNRKDRRKLQFTTDLNPEDIPGAIFVGEEVEEGPVTDEQAAKIRVKLGHSPAPPAQRTNTPPPRSLSASTSPTPWSVSGGSGDRGAHQNNGGGSSDGSHQKPESGGLGSKPRGGPSHRRTVAFH